jgi:hypothetical protein
LPSAIGGLKPRPKKPLRLFNACRSRTNGNLKRPKTSSRHMPASTPKPARNQSDRRRRRHPRYFADFRVGVSYLLENQYQNLEGHCRDLAEAGIGILLAAELNSGEVAGLSFLLPGSAVPWEVRAVVRYRRGYQYGFEFLSLTGEQQESLKSYIKGLEPTP